MDKINIEGVILTPLKKIYHPKGDIFHGMKKSDKGYVGFGEVYFSWVEHGVIKAWKCHQHMTLNLVVPLGEISFVFHIKDQENCFRTENIGEEKYVRLTVPPGIWFGFQGRGSSQSLLMNLADMAHDPDEVLRKKTSEIVYNWSTQ